MALTFEAMKNGYRNMWRSLVLKTGQDAVDTSFFANKIIGSELRYRGVQSLTGVPWFFIGALHMRESACRFDGVLHNGEQILGTGLKTRLVPAGRGPFTTWEEAAVDALKLKDLHEIEEWTIERMGFESERYNGFGYVGKGVNSPYVWAGSNHEQRGKYIADGVWDPNADDKQIGTMTVLKQLSILRVDIAAALAEGVPPVPVPADMVDASALFAALSDLFDSLAKAGLQVPKESVDKFVASLVPPVPKAVSKRKVKPKKKETTK